MNCARFEDQIALYVEGDLDARTAQSVEAHLGECAACRDLAASLAEGQAALKELRAEPADAWMLEQIRTRVLQQVAAQPPVQRPLLGWPWRFVLAGSLAAAMLGIFLWRSRPVQVPPPVVARAPQPPVMEPPAPRQAAPAPRAPRRRAVPQPRVETAAAQPLMVKLATDDPNVVIIWLIGQNGG